ncbi:PAS domain-containing protein [Methylobacterium sp. NEAU 140]|uniref:PAS domain-containing protein n=1 Tax=Methylobacterium sp. NEAU 140 TaxID=3064945 RepID=UPI002733607C|nr:PAS domain-containing protein [Methylobacterium sp. NEAU 140]MDP4025312.1 PAS domain-containing protein [Methylobacterium sp. NEAU 140]
MIFVTDANGRATFVSRDWEELTGQTLQEVVDYGWIRVVHPDDREVARNTVAGAIREQREFSVRYRVLRRDGRPLWVAAGAVPSFGPPERTFLGFLGSITPVAEAPGGSLRAEGVLGRFVPLPAHAAALPASALESVADHLIMAHALAVQGGSGRALPAIEAALRQVGLELAGTVAAEHDATMFH